MALLGRVDDPATVRWARAQLSRTTLATAVSAMHAVCGFTSDSWISQVDVPTAVVITARDRVVPPEPPAQAGPGDPGRIGPPSGRRSRGMHQRAAVVRPRIARGLLVGRARPRRHAAHTSLTQPVPARHLNPPEQPATGQGPLGPGLRRRLAGQDIAAAER